MGGARGDHSRYSEVSCVCLKQGDTVCVSVCVCVFNPSVAYRATVCCMFPLPLCFMGVDPEYCSFALHENEIKDKRRGTEPKPE